MVLLEAMAYGLPVLCSDIPGTSQLELPQQNYFAVKDVDALCVAITRLLNSPDERQHYDLEKYNWNTIAAATRQQLDL